MAAITSNTESWNGHSFSEVETHLKNRIGSYLPLTGGTMTNSATITFPAGDSSAYSAKKITFGGNFFIDLYGNFLFDSNSTDSNYWNVGVSKTGGVDANYLFTVHHNGNVGIGTTTPSCKLDVRGDMSIATSFPYLTISHTDIGVSVDLFVDDAGNLGFEGVADEYYFDNRITAPEFHDISDIRKKNKLDDIALDIYSIANAPTFKYTWNNEKKSTGVHVGTSAQYWQTILPEIVSEGKDDEKTLSMQYGVAGLVSSVTLARKVVEQEETIKAQEERIKTQDETIKEQEARIKALEDAIANIQSKLN